MKKDDSENSLTILEKKNTVIDYDSKKTSSPKPDTFHTKNVKYIHTQTSTLDDQ